MFIMRSRGVRFAVLSGAVATGAGCISVTATNGHAFSGGRHVIVDAVRDSAATDLHCAPASDLDVIDDSHNDPNVYDYVVKGCGWQATYRVQLTATNHFEVV